MPTVMNTASSRFRHARVSAMAPSAGPSTAMIVTAMVVAHANRVVACTGDRPAAAKSLKKRGNTAVMTVDQNADYAQSYIAQARSSGRWRPRRRSSAAMSEGLPRHPLAEERVDDDVARALLEQEILLDERGKRCLDAGRPAQ